MKWRRVCMKTHGFLRCFLGNNIKHTIKEVFQCGSQYHYTMETQSCVCIPVEDGMDVYPTTQMLDLTQVSIAECLNVKNNR